MAIAITTLSENTAGRVGLLAQWGLSILAKREQVDLTIAELKEFGIERLGVSHCTGLGAAGILAQEFGEGFFFNNAGSLVSF